MSCHASFQLHQNIPNCDRSLIYWKKKRWGYVSSSQCFNSHLNLMSRDSIWSAHLLQVKAKATEHNLPVHMDGARLMNAAVALNVTPQEILQHVDSVNMCFSKVHSYNFISFSYFSSCCMNYPLWHWPNVVNIFILTITLWKDSCMWWDQPHHEVAQL